MKKCTVHLSADRDIKRRFDIDFEALSLVYSLILSRFTKHFKVKVKIKHTNLDYSYYAEQRLDNIKIYIGRDTKSEYDFHSTLLHEFRHYIQDVHFKIPWNTEHYDDSTTESYNNSPSEIDANYFDKTLRSSVIASYNKLVKVKKSTNKTLRYNTQSAIG